MAVVPGVEADRELTLVLPSFRDGPQQSPQLLRADDEANPGAPSLLNPWVVPAVRLGPIPAVDVLLGLPAPDRPGVALGDSLRFLAEAAKLALELVARGRVLPSLIRHDDAWLARWRAITFDPGDADRVQLLAAAMPALLQAEVSSDGRESVPQAVVGDLLDTVVDACARRLQTNGLVARRGRRGTKRSGSAVEAWLAALTDADPDVHADAIALAALAEQVEEWEQGGERYAAHRMFRTCFRLSAPEDLPDAVDDGFEPGADGNAWLVDDGGELAPPKWRVEILLQAKEDPSVLVAAEEVWRCNGNGLRILGHRIEEPQERLLGDSVTRCGCGPSSSRLSARPPRPVSTWTPRLSCASSVTPLPRSSRAASPWSCRRGWRKRLRVKLLADRSRIETREWTVRPRRPMQVRMAVAPSAMTR